jgi:predicted deacylase
VYRVAAAGAADELWAPKLRAALARLLLWAAVIGTVLALPVTTLVYAITGVHA